MLLLVPLIDVFNYFFNVNSHLLDKFPCFGSNWHNIKCDSLEYVEESRLLILVELIKKFGIFVIVLLMQQIFPDNPPLYQSLIFFETDEVLSNILKFGLSFQK